MDSTITTTPAPSAPEPRRRSRSQRGFTLVEVLISSGISSLVVIAILTTFLFLGRSAANIRNYTDMESQARRALELFAEDTRQASAVSWTDARTVTLTVNAASITYAYNASDGTFSRKVGTAAASTLLTGITTFSFNAYTITTTQISDFSTAAARAIANRDTKQIQVSLSARRKDSTVVAATNTVLSARFILRNKRVTV